MFKTIRQMFQVLAPRLRVIVLFVGALFLFTPQGHCLDNNRDSNTEVAIASSVRLSPLTKLETAFEEGRITNAQRALLELRYIYDNDNYPAELRLSTNAPTPVKCGFGPMQGIRIFFEDLNAEDQAFATSVAARPSMQVAFAPPGGHFLLHYDTSGERSVPLEDLDVSGIPDFVEKGGGYLDSSWDLFHTTTGYLTPPSDGGIGGDLKYDVYFLKIASYGSTIFEAPGSEPWNDFTSYIQLHHTFLGFPPNLDPEGSQLGALKVTCAHEYFHAVQLAYDAGDSLWLYESGATSQEDALFPESHDNYQYFPFYWNNLDTFLTLNSGLHKYGAHVWPTYLRTVYTDTIMRTFWEFARDYDNMTSFDSALAQFGTSTKDEFQKFSQWHFLSGNRIQPGLFPDGANYPGATLSQTLPQIPFNEVSGITPPDGLGANFLALPTQGGPAGMLEVTFVGLNFVSWRLNSYLKDTIGIGYESSLLSPESGVLNSTIVYRKYNYLRWDTVFISPLVASPFLDDNGYTITTSVLPHGDADASGTINIADVTLLIAFIFTAGPPPSIELLLGDADCSNRVNIADVTLLIAHIFTGGPAPCTQ